MHGIYNYIRETNHVPRAYNAAAILWQQFMEHVLVFPMINVLCFCIIIIIIIIITPIKPFFIFSVHIQ